MELLALPLAASIWTSPAFSIFLMVIGFGLLIFVHELGHFLVAKRVGIKVEEFAIGFGPRLWSFRRGETEYRLNIIPLGGYVKMLGQDDFKPKAGEEADPRAYNNRPIWARIAVVSAGVVMNVIFAAVLFVVLFLVGMRYVAPQVGDVAPGSPAATVALPDGLGTGLEPGDQIIEFRGKPLHKFDRITVAAVLSDAGQHFPMRIRRPVGPDGNPVEFDITLEPRAELAPNGALRHDFGIEPPVSRIIPDVDEMLLQPMYVGEERFQGGDVIVGFAGRPVEHGWQVTQAMSTLTSEPVDVVVQRKVDGATVERTVRLQPQLTWGDAWIARRSDEVMRAVRRGDELPEPTPLNVLGLQPRPMVAAVSPETPAAEAGLQRGDVLTQYGDPPTIPTVNRMPKENLRYADGTLRVWVLRDGQQVGPVEMRPQRKGDVALIGIQTGYENDRLVVAGVTDDSPLKGQIDPGATLTAVNDAPVQTWHELIQALGRFQGQDVVLRYTTPAGGEAQTDPLTLTPEVFAGADYTWNVNVPVEVLRTEPVRTRNPALAAWWGIRETGDFIVTTYVTLKQAIAGRVSVREFSGPVGIFRAGVTVGSRGVEYIIWLLAIISANLAVINFLPLPIVDGGHVILLLLEKARGKPLSVRVQNVIQVAGLVAIAVVFVLVTWNDVSQWIRGI